MVFGSLGRPGAIGIKLVCVSGTKANCVKASLFRNARAHKLHAYPRTYPVNALDIVTLIWHITGTLTNCESAGTRDRENGPGRKRRGLLHVLGDDGMIETGEAGEDGRTHAGDEVGVEDEAGDEAGDRAGVADTAGLADRAEGPIEEIMIGAKSKTRRRKEPAKAKPAAGTSIMGTPASQTPVSGTVARTSGGRRHVRRLRRDASWSDPARRALFLEHLAATCNVTASAEAAGLLPAGAYKLRAQDAEFEAQWYGAREQARDHLWMLLHRHAAAQLEPAADRARRIAALGGDPDAHGPDAHGPDAHGNTGLEASVLAGGTGDCRVGESGGPHKVDPSWAMALLKLHKDEETRAERRRNDARRGARSAPLSADALRVLIFEKLAVRNKELGGDG